MTYATAHAYITDVKVLHDGNQSDYVAKFSAMAHARIMDVKVLGQARTNSLRSMKDGRTHEAGATTVLRNRNVKVAESQTFE